MRSGRFKIGWMLVISWAFVLLAGAAAPAGAAQASVQSAPISVVLDGKPLQLAVPPLLRAGGVIVPMKPILDALGIQVTVLQGRIELTNGKKKWMGRVNDTLVQSGSQKIRLTQAPVVENGRIYAPARLIGLASGKNVSYDAKLRKVVIGFTEADLKVYERTLFDASMSGDAKTVERMLERGVNPNLKLIKIYLDNIPLEYAVLHNHTEAARVLLEHGADIRLSSRDLASQAILNQNPELLRLLLSHGYEVNGSDRIFGSTYLELASGTIGRSSNQNVSYNQYPKPELVRTLLDLGADPGLDSSLYNAVQASSYPIIQLLLQAGADPYKENRHQDTPYRLAVSRGTTKWLTIQDQQPVIPELRIVDEQGKAVESGTVYMQSAEGRYDLDRWVNWESVAAYADLPDGLYNIVSVKSYVQTSVLNRRIRVAAGQFETGTLKLPQANVQGTATFEDAAMNKSGQLNLYNASGSYVCDVPLNKGQFKLYLPAGSYSFGQYFDYSGNTYAAQGTLTVPANGAIMADVKVTADQYVYPQPMIVQ